jgi:SAM-dependent methyltransferase
MDLQRELRRLEMRGDTHGAFDLLAKAAQDPNAPAVVWIKAADLAEQLGYLRERFDLLLEAAGRFPREAAVTSRLAAFLIAFTPRTTHPEIDACFLRAVETPWARPADLAPAVLRYLDLLPGDEAFATPLFAAIAAATPLPDPLWEERILAYRRRALLEGGPASAAVALQMQLTEYLHKPEPDEAAALATRSAADDALLRAMFEPPQQFPEVDALQRRIVVEPAEEARLRDELASIDVAHGDAALHEQYEQSPYPRWIAEPTGLPYAVPPAVEKRIATARFKAPKVLIAGCGTGQQILVIRDLFPRSHLTCVDFSRTSLAYAVRKCRELGVAAIDFQALDLLKVGSLGKSFDMVDCVGVLHHLEDPAAGLAALSGVIPAGGLLHLAAYSRRAREPVAALRDKIAAAGIPSTPDGVRDFRARVRKGAFDPLPPAIVYSPDYYSVSGLRDLLFNARERSFDLPEIVALAAGHGFKWMGLDIPPPLYPVAQEIFDKAPEELTPDQWDEVEQAAPFAFGGMYSLWFART